jgi:hypothetical protein
VSRYVFFVMYRDLRTVKVLDQTETINSKVSKTMLDCRQNAGISALQLDQWLSGSQHESLRSWQSHLRGKRSSKILNKVIKFSTCDLLLLPCDRNNKRAKTKDIIYAS